MCFSASASLIAASVISISGVFALSKARTYPMKLFAATPLFFALQQALEGVVWITLMHHDSTSLLNRVGVYGFLFFAGVFWPIWLSGCLYLLENHKQRKKLLLGIFIIGIIASSKILLRLTMHRHTALILDHHISYPMFALTYDVASLKHVLFHFSDILLTIAYLIAVVVPFFLSSIKRMWLIGAITAIGFVIAEVFYALAFGSVWCFFGALSTIATYFIVENYNKTH